MVSLERGSIPNSKGHLRRHRHSNTKRPQSPSSFQARMPGFGGEGFIHTDSPPWLPSARRKGATVDKPTRAEAGSIPPNLDTESPVSIHRAGEKVPTGNKRKRGHSTEEQPLMEHHARGQPAAAEIPSDRASLQLPACYGISPLPLSSTPCLPSPQLPAPPPPPLATAPPNHNNTLSRPRRHRRPHPWPSNRSRCEKIERANRRCTDGNQRGGEGPGICPAAAGGGPKEEVHLVACGRGRRRAGPAPELLMRNPCCLRKGRKVCCIDDGYGKRFLGNGKGGGRRPCVAAWEQVVAWWRRSKSDSS